MGSSPNIAEALAEAARAINAHHDLESTLQAIVHSAARSLPGVDHVGISIVHHDGTIETMAGTDQLVWDLDTLQYDLHEGPCYESIRHETVSMVEDFEREQRWPEYTPRAVARGLRSQMGLRLFVEDETLGGLNLYSTQARSIDPDVQHVATLFATHAALALGKARHVEDLNTALDTRQVIGQAVGILMERHQVNEERAFRFLVGVSNHSNIKLREIAQELVEQVGKAADAGGGQGTD